MDSVNCLSQKFISLHYDELPLLIIIIAVGGNNLKIQQKVLSLLYTICAFILCKAFILHKVFTDSPLYDHFYRSHPCIRRGCTYFKSC